MSDVAERRLCRAEAKLDRQDQRSECGDKKHARIDVCELLQESRYDPDPLTGMSLSGEFVDFVDPDTIGDVNPPNPFLSLVPGTTKVLRAGDEFEETIVVYVTDEVRDIQDVSAR